MTALLVTSNKLGNKFFEGDLGGGSPWLPQCECVFALVVVGPFVTEFAWFFFLKMKIGMPISQNYFEN